MGSYLPILKKSFFVSKICSNLWELKQNVSLLNPFSSFRHGNRLSDVIDHHLLYRSAPVNLGT